MKWQLIRLASCLLVTVCVVIDGDSAFELILGVFIGFISTFMMVIDDVLQVPFTPFTTLLPLQPIIGFMLSA